MAIIVTMKMTSRRHRKQNRFSVRIQSVTAALIAAVFSLILLSCGSESFAEDRLSFRQNGQITEERTAAFPKEKYNITLFEEEAAAAVRSYNDAAGSKRVRLLSVTEEEENAHVALRYRSYEDYNSFNHASLYYGTVYDGMTSLAIPGNVTVEPVGEGEKTTLRALSELEEEGKARFRVIAVSESVLIDHPGTPAYVSPGAAVNEDGSVTVNTENTRSGSPETVYIVYKK